MLYDLLLTPVYKYAIPISTYLSIYSKTMPMAHAIKSVYTSELSTLRRLSDARCKWSAAEKHTKCSGLNFYL